MAKKRGRPLLLEDSKREVAIALTTVGCSPSTVARYLGVHRETLRRTAQRDSEFAKRMVHAEAALEWGHVRKVTEAGGRSWRASAWMLERINPERFGKRRADAITRRELDEVLKLLVRIIVEEIADSQTRRQVLDKLQELQRKVSSIF